MNKILLLIGSKSLGDTLCALPTVKHISKIYNKKIHVFTYQPELFKNLPYVILTDNYDVDDSDTLIETFRPDNFVHTRTDIRQIHALSSGFQLLPNEMQVDFVTDEYIHIDNLPEKYVVVHPSKTWMSRTWSKEKWQKLVDELYKLNIPVVAIGKDSSENGTYNIEKPVYDLDIKNGLNLINSNAVDIHQTWHILNKSDIVITMDSGILHLAGATDTYIIQLGSSVHPSFRAPYRKGVQTYKYSYILGNCKIFCASDMKYNISHNNKHNVMSPVAYCLKNSDSIGDDSDLNNKMYECHPSVDIVIDEILKNYNFPNKGEIII